MKQNIKFFIQELIGVIISFLIAIVFHNILVVQTNTSAKTIFFINFRDTFFCFIPIYALYNCIRIIKLENKKPYLKQTFFQILQFIVIHTIISLFLSVIIIITRDKELINITNMSEYNFTYVFWYMIISTLLISFILVEILNLKKLIIINRKIFLRLIPLKIIILLFFFLFFGGGYETLCAWNPLIDTEYSSTFNIYKIDKVEIGMTKEDAIKLIGEPLQTYIGKEYETFRFTSDGKSKFKDNAWFDFNLKFENDILIKKTSRWVHD